MAGHLHGFGHQRRGLEGFGPKFRHDSRARAQLFTPWLAVPAGGLAPKPASGQGAHAFHAAVHKGLGEFGLRLQALTDVNLLPSFGNL